jgi:hypothetical protein
MSSDSGSTTGRRYSRSRYGEELLLVTKPSFTRCVESAPPCSFCCSSALPELVVGEIAALLRTSPRL